MPESGESVPQPFYERFPQNVQQQIGEFRKIAGMQHFLNVPESTPSPITAVTPVQKKLLLDDIEILSKATEGLRWGTKSIKLGTHVEYSFRAATPDQKTRGKPAFEFTYYGMHSDERPYVDFQYYKTGKGDSYRFRLDFATDLESGDPVSYKPARKPVDEMDVRHYEVISYFLARAVDVNQPDPMQGASQTEPDPQNPQ